MVEKNRGNTNENLVTKRNATDKALKDSRLASEKRTDSSFAVSRLNADAASAVSREKADAARILGNETGEESVRFERQRADEVIANERKSADDALLIERGEKTDVERILLEKERSLIDEHLAIERRQADMDLFSSAEQLKTERSAHLATKAALTTREELMAIVSHDLRDPIGAVSACGAMLLEDSNVKINSEARTWITFMKRNADAALRLVADLLDMERIANGHLLMKLDQFDLAELVGEVVQNYSEVAAAKSILLRSWTVAHLGRITCDRDRIVQAISNLVGNAVKFTPEGGKVDVQVSSGETGAGQVSVIDNGPGIAPDRIDRIFERFSQLGTKDRRGLGLGLYIAKIIADAHRGNLRVNSVVGKGSTFTLSLPSQLN